MGDLGVGCDPALVERVREADLVLAIGSRLPEAVTQGYTLFDLAGETPIIHVYPDAAEIGRVFRVALGIPTDLDAFAAAVRDWSPDAPPVWAEWTADLRALREAEHAVPDYEGKLNVAQCLRTLEEMAAPDAIFTTDAGNFATWATRFMHFSEQQRYIGPCNGAMGYGVPAAVGAKIAYPHRQVVGFVGDGGFLMTGQEIATAFHHGVAPIVLVFNNQMYGTIRMHQERDYPGRVSGTSLTNPDFCRLIEAFGGHGESGDRDGGVRARLRPRGRERPAGGDRAGDGPRADHLADHDRAVACGQGAGAACAQAQADAAARASAAGADRGGEAEALAGDRLVRLQPRRQGGTRAFS